MFAVRPVLANQAASSVADSAGGPRTLRPDVAYLEAGELPAPGRTEAAARAGAVVVVAGIVVVAAIAARRAAASIAAALAATSWLAWALAVTWVLVVAISCRPAVSNSPRSWRSRRPRITDRSGVVAPPASALAPLVAASAWT